MGLAEENKKRAEAKARREEWVSYARKELAKKRPHADIERELLEKGCGPEEAARLVATTGFQSSPAEYALLIVAVAMGAGLVVLLLAWMGAIPEWVARLLLIPIGVVVLPGYIAARLWFIVRRVKKESGLEP